MNTRSLQLASVIHRAVQSVLSEGLADPRLEAMITVTSVKVAENRKTATISVSVLPEKRQDLVMHGLRDAARHIRRVASDRVSLHKTPEFTFKLDRSVKKQSEILAALSQLEQERGESETPDSPDPPVTTTDESRAQNGEAPT